jgi:hypothetical protein
MAMNFMCAEAALFGALALRLRDNGFDPIPLRDKKPMLKNWQHPLSWDALEGLTRHRAITNIGILTAKLCVIDIDVEEPAEAHRLTVEVTQRLGNTDFIRVGRWPRRALFYRAPCRIPSSKIGPVEILSAGRQVAVAGPHPVTAAPYYWTLDSVMDAGIADLPEAERGAVERLIPWLRDRYGGLVGRGYSHLAPRPSFSGQFPAGGTGRNVALFDHLRAAASAHDHAHSLVKEAEAFAISCNPPLSVREAHDTARSVWNYKEDGRLIAPLSPGTFIPAGSAAILKLCRDYPYAVALYTVLGSTRHSAKSFTIPIASTAKATGMSQGTIQKAIRILKAHHLLKGVGTRGGSSTRRAANLYSFDRPTMLSDSIEGYTGQVVAREAG